MNMSSLGGASLRFGPHTVRLRARFVQQSAAVSMAGITRRDGPNEVMIPAVLVPEGTSAPGYPYEHIAQALFAPDQDDISNSSRANSQQPPSGEVLVGMHRDAPTLANNGQRSPRQFAAPAASAPWFGAPGAGDAASNTVPAPTPRRSVRSAQANFSAAVPQPHLDNSRDAVNAADRALMLQPSGEALPRSVNPAFAAGRPAPQVATKPSTVDGDIPQPGLQNARLQAMLRLIRSAENRDDGDREEDLP